MDGKIKIAVLEEQLKGLRSQQKAHSDEMRHAISDLRSDMQDVLAMMNKGRGALWGFSLLGGVLGAGAIKFMGRFVG